MTTITKSPPTTPALISWDDVSRRTGYDRSYISRVRRGLQRPSLEAAQRLAEALGITLDELYATLRPLWSPHRRGPESREDQEAVA